MTDRGYEQGYRDGLAIGQTPGLDDPDREPGAHNVGNLTREDIRVMTAEEINSSWIEVQRVLKGQQ